MDITHLRPGVLLNVKGKTWLVDLVENGYVYARPVRDCVAYLPGVKIPLAELESRADEVEEVTP